MYQKFVSDLRWTWCPGRWYFCQCKYLPNIWDWPDTKVDDIFYKANICQIFKTDLIPRSMSFFPRQIPPIPDPTMITLKSSLWLIFFHCKLTMYDISGPDKLARLIIRLLFWFASHSDLSNSTKTSTNIETAMLLTNRVTIYLWFLSHFQPKVLEDSPDDKHDNQEGRVKPAAGKLKKIS